jgi:YgiT-type zinc finger domain-containing protein
MKCVICHGGETRPGKTVNVLERNGTTLVFRDVPAAVCENCGEEYLAEQTTTHLLELAEAASRAGVQVEIREYATA